MRGRLERCRGSLGVARLEVEANIARRFFVYLRRAVGDGGIEIGVGRQRRDVEFNQIGGITRLRQRFGDHRDDRLADIAHAARGQHRTRRLDQGRAVAALHRQIVGQGAEAGGLDIGVGIDRQHAGRGLGGVDADAPDIAMGKG